MQNPQWTITPENMEPTGTPSCQTCEPPDTNAEEMAEDMEVLSDLWDARELINRANTLVAYISDENLCRTITERERQTMDNLCSELSEFEVEMIEKYDEPGTEG